LRRSLRLRRSFSAGAQRRHTAGGFGGILGIYMIIENPVIHPTNPSNPKILLNEEQIKIDCYNIKFTFQRIEIRCYKINFSIQRIKIRCYNTQPRLRLCT